MVFILVSLFVLDMGLFDNQVLSMMRHGDFRDFPQLLSACQSSLPEAEAPGVREERILEEYEPKTAPES